MVFSSHLFVFYFLPLSLACYYLLPRRFRNLVLGLLSYIFYGWSNPLFMGLMFFSTVVDYCCGWYMGSSPTVANRGKRKAALVFSIVSNLCLLGVFKYSHFALENYTLLMGGGDALGIESGFRFILPLGISFYTFQSMSYSIDVYRGEARYQRNFIDFSCYVAMFPQLVAGPIIRFQEVAEQLRGRSHSLEKFSRGIALFSLGMAKKILLANTCGKIADLSFGHGMLPWADAWYGALAYTFQIYFDFSGYSDMAIGLGLMFGFVFPKNFSSPYKSASITEFWRRWHISLSTWLREYLYLPLGGNRQGRGKTWRNLFIVMFIGGLWHGASWNFVLWGLFHGSLLGLERFLGRFSFYFRLRRPLRVGISFILVLLSWVLFRAETLPQAGVYYAAMFGFGEVPQTSLLVRGVVYQPYYLMVMAISSVVVWGCPQGWDWSKDMGVLKVLVLGMLLVMAIFLMTVQSYNPFIYFNF